MPFLPRRFSIFLPIVAVVLALAACGGGGGGSGSSIPTAPGGGATPTPGFTATPTPANTSTPTPVPTSSTTPSSAVIIGKIVDATSGNPVVGITVAVEAATSANTAGMSGTSAPNGALTATTDLTGSFTISNTLPSGYQTNFYFDAYGSTAYSNNTIHVQISSLSNLGASAGTLSATGTSNIGTFKLTKPNADEIAALAQINTFRAAPGPIGGPTYPQYANTAVLIFDEALMEQAAYWASQVHVHGTAGHTCATIGSPAGCIDPNTYLESLPGQTSTSQSAQNVGTGFVDWNGNSATTYYNQAAEAEGAVCTTPYEAIPVNTCPGGDPPAGAGHFQNVMGASRFAGLSEILSNPNSFVQQYQ